jgi:hypothetical protein
MNAYFRWKNVRDTAAGFALQLWIDHPAGTMTTSMPKSATADVTLRRLQQLKIAAGQTYAWQFTREGRVLASGKLAPDAVNLLTMPQVPLSTTPGELTLRPETP